MNADYKTAALEIRKGGYATDPNYTQLLINIIEQYKLYQYDTKEGEQSMTAAEQREFEELKSTIKQQAEWIKSQKEMTEMPCPSRAKDASKSLLAICWQYSFLRTFCKQKHKI